MRKPESRKVTVYREFTGTTKAFQRVDLVARVQGFLDTIDYTEVRAPFDGIVSARLADVGALVGAGGPTKLASIYRNDPMYVSFAITEQQAILARSHTGKSGLGLKEIAPIPVEVGMPTEPGFPHAGRIDYVAPDLDAATGALRNNR